MQSDFLCGTWVGRRNYLIWRGFVVCVVRGRLQMVILVVVGHQFHSVLSL